MSTPKSKVAIVRTQPSTVLFDYHRLMNLADYQRVIAKDVETALKINISWHFFFPGSSTTPWQLEGVIRAMKRDGARFVARGVDMKYILDQLDSKEKRPFRRFLAHLSD